MKKISPFILIFILAFPAVLIAAEGDKNKEVPVGMELISVGKVHKVLVPEGTKMHKKGSLLIMENINEYVARSMHDMKESILKIEANEEKLKKEIEQLKEDLTKHETSTNP
jgi:hypothetical protein